MNNKKYSLGSKIKPESVESMKFLKSVNPKFAEHMFHQNRIVEAFAMSEFGGVDMLNQPVCRKCEKPGWNIDDPTFVSTGDEDKDREIRNCYCVSCGTTSKNTLTLREYLIQELNLQEENIEKLENNLYGGIAL
jgi:hypothetical protein